MGTIGYIAQSTLRQGDYLSELALITQALKSRVFSSLQQKESQRDSTREKYSRAYGWFEEKGSHVRRNMGGLGAVSGSLLTDIKKKKGWGCLSSANNWILPET